MAKNSIIMGRYIAPGTIKVTKDDGQHLVEGQRVLVYRPTDRKIVSCSTGRVIGKKEKVLGSGVVNIKEGRPIIITITAQKSRVSETPKWYLTTRVAKPIVSGKKFIKAKTNLDLLIKPIVE